MSVTQRLTQSFVDAQIANGRDHIIFDSQLSGLGLRITPTGTRIFVAQGRVAGRKRRVTVGFADRMTLSQARSEALQTLAAMRQGRTPRRTEKLACGRRKPKASPSVSYQSSGCGSL